MKTFSFLCSLFILCLGYSQQTPVMAPQTTQTPASKTLGCISGDCQNGWGKRVYDNGYYTGFFSNSKRSGYGFYDWDDAGNYVGWWVNDNMEGYGVYFYNDHDEMSGEFKNGQLNGLGRDFKNDKWTMGYYKNAVLETEYTFYTNGIDIGCVAGDCNNKYGQYKWANGDEFKGFFSNGNMLLGTYTFSNGDKYEGMFNSQNRFQGQGRFFFKSGEYFAGEWANGSYNGLGYYYDKNKESKKGVWTNGVLTKQYY